jgi:hypothetical protein
MFSFLLHQRGKLVTSWHALKFARFTRFHWRAVDDLLYIAVNERIFHSPGASMSTGGCMDLYVRAFRVVQAATAEPTPPDKKKESARKGGLKGGPSRARTVSAARRSEIAKKASAARWSAKIKTGQRVAAATATIG